MGYNPTNTTHDMS